MFSQTNESSWFIRLLFAHYFMHKHASSTLRNKTKKEIKNPNHRASRGIQTNICAEICLAGLYPEGISNTITCEKSREKRNKNYGMFVYFGRWANLPTIHSVPRNFYASGIRNTLLLQRENKCSTFKMRSHRMQCTLHTLRLLTAACCFLDFIQDSKETKTDVFARITINSNNEWERDREREMQQKSCVL